MATNFEINVNKLGSDVGTAKEKLTYIEQNISRMFSEIKELDAMWDGAANNAFNVQFNADYEMMKQVCSDINRLIGSMEYSKNQYQSCESQISSAINALRF